MDHSPEICGLPPSTRIVHAYGVPVSESLSDEYYAPPERQAAFAEELRKMEAEERQAAIDDRDVRL